VAQKDRISIEVSDLRHEIETCRNDVTWSELSLSAKIRVLIKERLEELKTEQTSPLVVLEGKEGGARSE
jgi:hypothetical protein